MLNNCFKTLMRGLDDVDSYLRNDPPRDPWFDAGPGLTKYAPDLFDRDEPDPIRTRVYWFVRRWAKRVWSFPSDAYYAIRFAYQRVAHGYAIRDTWALDYHLNTWMPSALRFIKEHSHGVSFSYFPEGAEYIDEHGNPTDAACDIAKARWTEAIDKMIAGFEAGARIDDGIYEAELGPYPLHRPDGVSRDAWAEIHDKHFKALRALEARDQAILEEGLALFAKHYQTLGW